MTVTSPGATAPVLPASLSASQRAPLRVVTSTRTRRNHGVFMLGDELATVYSSRRESGGLGVTLSVGCGTVMLTGSMTPTQARAMARALCAAAIAVDAVQQGGAA